MKLTGGAQRWDKNILTVIFKFIVALCAALKLAHGAPAPLARPHYFLLH